MTMSDFGSPLSSSTAPHTSMPSLEERTVSFEEGSVSDAVDASTSQASGQEEGSSSSEELSTASVAFRGEIFALNTAPSMADTDDTPPKTIAEGMQHPDRKAALQGI